MISKNSQRIFLLQIKHGSASTFSITFKKIFHNSITKDILCIHHIKGNIQYSGNAPRLRHCVGRATTVGVFLARLGP